LTPQVATARSLPIYEKRDAIVDAIHSSQIVIVAGETGSGKTTQLPLICFEAGLGTHGKIGVTQPRRIAATSVASYVALQLSCQLGSFVGYKVRFTDRESAQTKITFMTDGILLRELQTDRLLSRYSVIIIDEVHERSLNIDFLIGYMKRLLPRRPDLRLVLSSATMDTAVFSAAFGNAPVISVSGRMFPIDILHQEPESDGEEELSFVNVAARVAQELVESSESGDVLVFMPTERDILETRDILAGRMGDRCLIAPLFGRMPLAEQTAVFQPSAKRKIVVATNIAETSVTVPGIRFVVDTGLARVKQFDPGMGVTRLPVEPVSQASARQRAGRCGRVQDGMCVRLYSEEDLLSRPLYTPPEILRSNLGQVILSMAALNLGPLEEFPFLQHPSRQAVSQGYRSLFELGAIDEARILTDAGMRMARFPLDPGLSRMILEAQREHCVPDMLVIASALCVSDMRVRPAEKKEMADAAHARFSDPLSDFLFYLKLWDAAGFRENGKRSLTQLRRFCKDHLLSFVRMREWRDVHDQLLSIIHERDRHKPGKGFASYDQIHRCVLSGFVSHVAKKTDEGAYQVARGRISSVFPGSSLFKKKPDWIVSAELVETSRLYSRTCASVDPLWLETLVPHLCKRRFSEPFFDEETGGVKAKETVSLFGLVIVAGRTIGYGRVNPAEANDIFIREGLCSGRLASSYKFYKHNLDTKHRLESLEKKLRSFGTFIGEEAMVAFYKARIPGVTSVHELNAFLHNPGAAETLIMKESDLGGLSIPDVAVKFPDSVVIGKGEYAIVYEFDPSSELDGPSVRIASGDLPFINHSVFDWIVPGLFEPRIRFVLESLPRSIKQPLGDLANAAKFLAESLHWDGRDFLDCLCDAAEVFLGIALDHDDLPVRDFPPHLMVKVIIDKSGKPAGGSTAMAWHDGERNLTKANIRTWNMGDLPQKVEVVPAKNGFPIFGFPSLVDDSGTVACSVFMSEDDSAENHPGGVRMLAEIVLEKEFAWLYRDLATRLQKLSFFVKANQAPHVCETVTTLVRAHCFAEENCAVWTKPDFDALLERARIRLREASVDAGVAVSSIFSDYSEVLSVLRGKAKSGRGALSATMAAELKSEFTVYMDRFLSGTLGYEMLVQYPRYFKSFRVCIERAFSNPAKYQAKQQSFLPYANKCAFFLLNLSNYNSYSRSLVFGFCGMVEEFKISLFAQQEIKTLFPVSEKRLDQKLLELKAAGVW
jgi:ATP-dependent helicase HrpA